MIWGRTWSWVWGSLFGGSAPQVLGPWFGGIQSWFWGGRGGVPLGLSLCDQWEKRVRRGSSCDWIRFGGRCRFVAFGLWLPARGMWPNTLAHWGLAYCGESYSWLHTFLPCSNKLYVPAWNSSYSLFVFGPERRAALNQVCEGAARMGEEEVGCK
jgi:hypothetical protein